MIRPVIVPLESLEAEEDNEPPSLDSRDTLFPYSIFHMDSPAFILKSKPKFIQNISFLSDTFISGIIRQGFCFRISHSGSVGEVLTLFPRSPISGSPRC
jgi:hypothetical protein